MDIKQTIKSEHIKRKTIFMIIQIFALICLYKNILEVAICLIFLLTSFVGIMLFKLIEQINEERGIDI